jgi:phthiocerol/phenolphthiocerol synthesis type-I polyketide synthase B
MTPLAIREWLIEFVEQLLDVPAGRIDVLMSLDMLGVDSATTLVMAGELSDLLGVELSPVELVEHTTIEALTAHLAAQPVAGV